MISCHRLAVSSELILDVGLPTQDTTALASYWKQQQLALVDSTRLLVRQCQRTNLDLAKSIACTSIALWIVDSTRSFSGEGIISFKVNYARPVRDHRVRRG